jgi:phosphoribosylaminoimidazole carboxylase (NCAIR synthetase)
MEFTFEYNNGELSLYDGQGDKKEKVSLDNLGWKTSDQFVFVAKEVYKAFKEAMKTLSREPGYDGKGQGLVGTLTLDLENPFTEEVRKKIEASRE